MTDQAARISALSDMFTDLAMDPQQPLRGGLLRGSRLPFEWLVKGALDEDGILSINPLRFRNHFYDPVNDRGLTTALATGERAPDWALEDGQSFLTQGFSYRDARNAFLAALTGRSPTDREAAWAETFEVLGHVMHLVQDMASPPHTRNDIHAGVPGFGAKSLFEVYLDRNVDRLNFDSAPIRLDRPRDYWATGDGRGLAEFTNRNFVSEGTNFAGLADGATGGGYGSPVLRVGEDEERRPFESVLDIQTQLEPGLRDRQGEPIQGTVTFFANNFHDPFARQRLRNDRMTTLSLFDRDLLRKGAAPLFTLNRYNIEAQAAFLVPRAVGYSAGLLDYFFRGRLEPTLNADPAEPNRFLLTFVNRSPEAVGPGTLALYVDDALGNRTAVEDASLALTVPVAKDHALGSLAIDPLLEPQALTAVYRGQLGHELDAVIGKVRPAAEVEQVFRGAGDWMLRTADGIFPLGLGVGRSQVKWGDRDNTLVARTFLPDGDQRFEAFQINRPEGSRVVPLKAPDPLQPTQPIVDLSSLGPPVTLGGDSPIDLGSTIHITRIVEYTQYLAVVAAKIAYRFDDEQNVWVQESRELSTERATQPARAETFTRITDAALAMPLDLPPDTPYGWFLQDFYLDRAGDVLALVGVGLTFPDALLVPLRRHDEHGTLTDVPSSVPVVLQPPNLDLFFLVNLTRRVVVAKSSGDRVEATLRDTQQFVFVDLHEFHHRDAVEERWTTLEPTGPVDLNGREPVVAEVTLRLGPLALAGSGVRRPELAAAGFWAGTALSPVATTSSEVALLERAAEGTTGAAIRIVHVDAELPSALTIAEIRRSDGPATGVTLLAQQGSANGEQFRAFQWFPLEPAVRPLRGLSVPAGVQALVSLPAANRTSALARVNVFAPSSARQQLTHLLTEREELVFSGTTGTALAANARLLEPGLLLDVSDLRFHRLSSGLESLSAPRPLAPGGPALGEYHVVGRP